MARREGGRRNLVRDPARWWEEYWRTGKLDYLVFILALPDHPYHRRARRVAGLLLYEHAHARPAHKGNGHPGDAKAMLEVAWEVERHGISPFTAITNVATLRHPKDDKAYKTMVERLKKQWRRQGSPLKAAMAAFGTPRRSLDG